MKNQKGFIQIPLLVAVIVGVLVMGGIGYVGVKQYQNYQAEKIEKEKTAQETERLKQEEAKQREGEKQKMENLQKEIDVLKNKPSQIIVKNIPTQENDLSLIIKQWQSIIVYIECNFYYRDNGVWGDKYLTQAGSGTLQKIKFYISNSAEINILTNKHVALDEKYAPKSCVIQFPNHPPILVDNSLFNSVRRSAEGYDWAIIDLAYPPDFVLNIAHQLKTCGETASIGDKIIILGYPAIGSHTDITATEGIISSYDGDYYITSAKVEQGNSGGAAILVKNNCYLGIPTFAQVGEIESLARILNIEIMFR